MRQEQTSRLQDDRKAQRRGAGLCGLTLRARRRLGSGGLSVHPFAVIVVRHLRGLAKERAEHRDGLAGGVESEFRHAEFARVWIADNFRCFQGGEGEISERSVAGVGELVRALLAWRGHPPRDPVQTASGRLQAAALEAGRSMGRRHPSARRDLRRRWPLSAFYQEQQCSRVNGSCRAHP